MRRFIYVIFGIAWSLLNIFDKDKVKKKAYNKGYEISQRFKKYKGWDEIIEPMIITQFSFLFGISNSFIKGMISDNKNIDKDLKELNEICSHKD